MQETKDGLAIQITIDENEKPREKLAADQFFSSLLGTRIRTGHEQSAFSADAAPRPAA
jgi:hypothetical protein